MGLFKLLTFWLTSIPFCLTFCTREAILSPQKRSICFLFLTSYRRRENCPQNKRIGSFLFEISNINVIRHKKTGKKADKEEKRGAEQKIYTKSELKNCELCWQWSCSKQYCKSQSQKRQRRDYSYCHIEKRPSIMSKYHLISWKIVHKTCSRVQGLDPDEINLDDKKPMPAKRKHFSFD